MPPAPDPATAPLQPPPWPDSWSLNDVRQAIAHQKKHAAALLAPLKEFRQRGFTHPVYDFLTDYYSFRMAHLSRWSPGAGAFLDTNTLPLLDWPAHWHTTQTGRLTLNLQKITPQRWLSFRWIAQLLRATSSRPPHLGCAGLHEWAMVYQASDIRHPKWPLRLGHHATRQVVESLPLTCTHFDAFRFFSSPARPLNRFHLSPQNRLSFEQPACLHANMDLFKWCLKLAPFLPSTYTLQAFSLAWQAREIDMRASPYDLTALGFQPIPIETPQGRRAYEEAQRTIMAKAAPLRATLLSGIEWLLRHQPQNQTPHPP